MNFYLIKSKIYDDCVGFPTTPSPFIIAAESMTKAIELFTEEVDDESEIENLSIERLNITNEPYLSITSELADNIYKYIIY